MEEQCFNLWVFYNLCMTKYYNQIVSAKFRLTLRTNNDRNKKKQEPGENWWPTKHVVLFDPVDVKNHFDF